MEEKSKVEQFEEGLEELIREEKVYFDLSYEEDEAAKELIEKLEPDPEEREQMIDILSDHEAEERGFRWEWLTEDLIETVKRYGGNPKVVRECVDFYRENGYAEDSIFEGVIDFAENPYESEDIYWGYYFRFFPDEKVPEGMTAHDYLRMQYELLKAREHARSNINWFVMGVAHRIIHLKFGENLSNDELWAIYRANAFKNFYPEFIASYEEAAKATKERAQEIAREYSKLESKTKSTARRLLKVTPELVIPEEVKGKISQ